MAETQQLVMAGNQLSKVNPMVSVALELHVLQGRHMMAGNHLAKATQMTMVSARELHVLCVLHVSALELHALHVRSCRILLSRRLLL